MGNKIGSDVFPELVRAELEKVLSSAMFANATRLSRFLRFVVEQTLAGSAAQIKEYPIGVEVFDRGEVFDPRVDPVVRVEARRLRAKLAEYYETDGHNDEVKIALPKGSYVPVFEQTEPAVETRERRKFPRWALPAVIVVVAAAAIYLTASQRREPIVAVVPTTGLDEPEAAIRFGRAVSEELTAQFARSGRVRAVAWPAVMAYQAQRGTVSWTQFAREMHAEYLLVVSVRAEGDHARILVHLIVPAKNSKIWAADYDRQITADALSTESELARQIEEEVLGRLERGK
jgi:TolB-like protein